MMNKHIAFQIALAQRASDIGKYYRLTDEEQALSDRLGQLLGEKADARAQKQGYSLKDQAIYDAIRGIGHNPGCGIHFRVTIDDEKKARFIVYFDFRTKDGKRRQLSFHSFDKRIERYVEKRASGHWDKTYARAVAVELLESL